MVEVHGCWRLKLIGGNTAVLHTIPDCYTFMDTSTCPSKYRLLAMCRLSLEEDESFEI